MLFVFLLPLVFAIIFAVIVPLTRRKATPTNPEQTNADPGFPSGQQAPQQAPVRPTVQPNVKPTTKQPIAPRMRSEAEPQPQKKVPVKQPAPSAPIAANRVQEAQPMLAFSGSDAMRGILYAEILGKPKALRKS